VPGRELPELELTYNFETPEGGYELGTGYGHIALTIDDLDETLARLREKGIEPERPPYTVREDGSRRSSSNTSTPSGDVAPSSAAAAPPASMQRGSQSAGSRPRSQPRWKPKRREAETPPNPPRPVVPVKKVEQPGDVKRIPFPPRQPKK
jgi:hypothetical protein